MSIDLQNLYRVIDATWPAAAMKRIGPWTIRKGQGGGQRVSAATAEAEVKETDIPKAEEAMRGLGQAPLFMIRSGETKLDQRLDTLGYKIVDPVNLYLGHVDPLAVEASPRALVFSIWPPLAIQLDIWKSGGIEAERIAVMQRAAGAKTSILGRYDQTPAATCFVAVSEGVAMIHALEVIETCRRAGVGVMLTKHAAGWAKAQGASHIAALCTQANVGANTLYSSLGLSVVGQYHYRKLIEG